MSRALAPIALVVVLLIAVLVLRAETMSVHTTAPPGTVTTVVIEASANNAEPTASRAELVRALVLMCRLEVDAELHHDLEARGGGTFVFALTPALDETDRRQLTGCLEDLRVDHVQASVVALEDG